MKRRALLVLGILAVTSMTWVAAPRPAMSLPLCDCNFDWDCFPDQICKPVLCSDSGGFFSGVCR